MIKIDEKRDLDYREKFRYLIDKLMSETRRQEVRIYSAWYETQSDGHFCGALDMSASNMQNMHLFKKKLISKWKFSAVSLYSDEHEKLFSIIPKGLKLSLERMVYK